MTGEDRPLRLVVVAAGASVPSTTRMLADRVATATVAELEARGRAVETTVVDVRELGHDLADAAVSRLVSPALRSALDAVAAADGIATVTPIYNQSYSGLFKLFWDVVDRTAVAGVPLALGATGGTARHSLAIDYAMRPMFAALKADVVPTSIFAASEDFGAASSMTGGDGLAVRVGRVALELAEYMLRFAGDGSGVVAPTRPAPEGMPEVRRGRATEDDEFADFVPMDRLLGPRAGG